MENKLVSIKQSHDILIKEFDKYINELKEELTGKEFPKNHDWVFSNNSDFKTSEEVRIFNEIGINTKISQLESFLKILKKNKLSKYNHFKTKEEFDKIEMFKH